MPTLNNDTVINIVDNKYLRMYDLQYDEGRHYFCASRRNKDNLICLKDSEELAQSNPDAVTIITVLNGKLLLEEEYRYPTGRFLLSPPAGLLDSDDGKGEEGIIKAAIRELKEETGIIVKESDKVSVVNSFLFSSPGMTDESNAVALAVINGFDESKLTFEGCEGSELFRGYKLLTQDDAKRILANGKDDDGCFYSIYTYVALNYYLYQFELS